MFFVEPNSVISFAPEVKLGVNSPVDVKSLSMVVAGIEAVLAAQMAQNCDRLVVLNTVLVDPEGDLSSRELASSLQLPKLFPSESSVCKGDSCFVEKHANCFSLPMQREVKKGGYV